MKTKYLILMILLILALVGFERIILFSPLGEHPRLEKAIQSAGLFIALIAAVIALSTADPKTESVRVKIENSVDATTGWYPKNQLSEELKNFYGEAFPDPIKSNKVQFRITNISGCTLKKPTWTFRLPLEKAHPSNEVKQVYCERSFNSNLFNSQRELQLLEFADTHILSNSNLPYCNDQDNITIWIRMVLDDGRLEPFIVEISVNCENADGITKKITINPKDWQPQLS